MYTILEYYSTVWLHLYLDLSTDHLICKFNDRTNSLGERREGRREEEKGGEGRGREEGGGRREEGGGGREEGGEGG